MTPHTFDPDTLRCSCGELFAYPSHWEAHVAALTSPNQPKENQR